ncbi:MAG TPA: hypothetical protein VGY31_09275 [Terriglobia bacterium]|nr:hypothetical protein [Terriglobia bacterium]
MTHDWPVILSAAKDLLFLDFHGLNSRCFAEFTLSQMPGSFAPLRMTSEGLSMTSGQRLCLTYLRNATLVVGECEMGKCDAIDTIAALEAAQSFAFKTLQLFVGTDDKPL